MKEWTLKDAEKHFSEIYSAAQNAPQVITDGTTTVVVQRKDDAETTGKASEEQHKVLYKGKMMGLGELLHAMPHKEGFEIERVELEPHDIEF